MKRVRTSLFRKRRNTHTHTYTYIREGSRRFRGSIRKKERKKERKGKGEEKVSVTRGGE